MKCDKLENRKITIDIYEHEATGWFVAKSEDVPRFYVHGASVEKIRSKVPRLLRAFYEASGYCVASVNTKLEKSAPEGFFPVKLLANARIDPEVPA
jgi:hypothetical protein